MFRAAHGSIKTNYLRAAVKSGQVVRIGTTATLEQMPRKHVPNGKARVENRRYSLALITATIMSSP
jgi:hypothetical protein